MVFYLEELVSVLSPDKLSHDKFIDIYYGINMSNLNLNYLHNVMDGLFPYSGIKECESVLSVLSQMFYNLLIN